MRHNLNQLGAWLGAVSAALWAVPLGQAQVQVTDNVVVVVDASGSMGANMAGTGRDRMSVAKDALKQVLDQIPDTTHVGILVFPRGNWVYPLGPRKESMLAGAIDSIQSGGGTPLGEYMKRGADVLLDARRKQFGYGTYRLLVVTDGEAGDARQVEAYTPDIIARGITIDCIGVEMASRHTLATKVHSYRNANDPESLKQAISEVFAEVASGDASQTGEDAFELIADLPEATASACSSRFPPRGTSRSASRRACALSSRHHLVQRHPIRVGRQVRSQLQERRTTCLCFYVLLFACWVFPAW